MPERTVQTACTYDCPDACAQLVTVVDGGSGARRLVVRGDPDHPITRGFVCPRMRQHVRRLSDPERLTTPLVRTPAGLRPCGWEEALDRAATALGQVLRDFGAPAVVHVTSGGSLGIRKELVGHFFRSLGPVTTLRGGVCGDCGEEAHRQDFGDCAGHDWTDLKNARAVVLWGKDCATTAPHLVPFLREARRRGAEVVLIDVRRTRTAAHASRFVRVAPGGDGFLALAVLRRIHDRGALDPAAGARCENLSAFVSFLTGPGREAAQLARLADVPMLEVDALAELYSGCRPVATQLGWGMQRRRSGGRVIRCIDALGMLSGNIGIAGGGVSFTSWRKRGLDLSMLAPARGRTLATPAFGRELAALCDPPARFVFIHGANPVAQFADSKGVAAALRGAGFVVVAEAFLTDTAQCADLVLPVTLNFEEEADAVGSYQHHHVAWTQPVIPPPDGVREDVWIAAALAARLGRPADPLLDDPAGALRRMTAAWLDDPPGAGRSYQRNPAHPVVPYADGFPTPTGKMRLTTELPERASLQDGYPLLLLSPKPERFEHSQIPPEAQRGPLECRVNPQANGAAGFSTGDRAILRSPLLALEVVVRLDPEVHPEVCVVESGGWLQLGRAVNALVAEAATDVGDNTAFCDQRVRLDRGGPEIGPPPDGEHL